MGTPTPDHHAPENVLITEGGAPTLASELLLSYSCIWWVRELSCFPIRLWLLEAGIRVYLPHLTMLRQFSGKTLLVQQERHLRTASVART